MLFPIYERRRTTTAGPERGDISISVRPRRHAAADRAVRVPSVVRASRFDLRGVALDAAGERRCARDAEPEAGESHNEALSRRRFNRRAPVELKRTLRFGRAEDFAEEEVRLMERYAKPQMVMKEKV